MSAKRSLSPLPLPRLWRLRVARAIPGFPPGALLGEACDYIDGRLGSTWKRGTRDCLGEGFRTDTVAQATTSGLMVGQVIEGAILPERVELHVVIPEGNSLH